MSSCVFKPAIQFLNIQWEAHIFNIFFLSRLVVAVSCLSVGLPRGCVATPCTRHFCGYGCKGCGCVEAGGPLKISQSKSAVQHELSVEFWGEARSEGVDGMSIITAPHPPARRRPPAGFRPAGPVRPLAAVRCETLRRCAGKTFAEQPAARG